MNDHIPPKPWLDDPALGPEVRDLLRLGQVDGPSDADLARLASRIAPAIGLAVLAAPTQALAETVAPANPAGFAPSKVAVAQGWAFKAFLPALLKGVAVVGTVGLTALLWPKAPTQPAPATQVQPRVLNEAPQEIAPEAPAPQFAAPAPEVAPVAEESAAPAPSKAKDRVERRAKPAAKLVEPAAPVAIESELTLIRRAQDLRGQPAEMLSVLAAHERGYPEGMLVQEREVLAIEALLATGKRAEAEKRASRMEQRFSDSAHLRRVRVLLETSTPE